MTNAIKTNDFVICVGTVNGSGSQSANTILLKTLFRMGIPVGGKNVFPSNIAGLPTWFWIRANEKGYTGRRKEADVVVAMNPQTLIEDQKLVKAGGYFIFNSDSPNTFETTGRKEINYIGVPFKKLVDQATDQIKIKKMLVNIIYVGVLAHLFNLDKEVLLKAMQDQFGDKASVVEPNLKAFDLGLKFAQENFSNLNFPMNAKTIKQDKKYVLMEGNTAGALGAVFGGCTFAAWYPITPSSSIMEGFIKYSSELRTDEAGKKKVGVVQAEDELASICMVLGAGWAGARAMTATSGPGISLMSEASGYAYYAEVPSVIWDVQRVGPSTGMPTRTAQGDILSTLYLSHGDTKHPMLLPATVKECFDFGQTSFDLAERLQQLVFVMSDLDLGMNLWREEAWDYPTKPYDRGKVLTAKDLESLPQYFRYTETDNDAIAPRTLPGTESLKAAYFTRGSGHNAKGAYTENSEEYQIVLDRLARKWETAKQLVPKPVISNMGSDIGIIAFGTTDSPMQEARDLLAAASMKTDYLRLRALPFTEEVLKFIESHKQIFVIEQNRDGQMYQILCTEFLSLAHKFVSIRHYDGSPITAEAIIEPITKNLKKGAL